MSVSVICTVKNGEKVIEETVQSIIDQTFQDWTFIVVDDGSTDSTAAILQRFAQLDSRITVITTEGVGRAWALNIAIEHARGKYIANIDADDPSHRTRLERQHRLLEERPDIACLVSESVIVRGLGRVSWPVEVTTETVQKLAVDTLYKRNPINHSSLFIRKSTLQQVGSYDERRQSLFDYELWLRLLRHGHIIHCSNYRLASKRLHAEQSYESKKRISYLLATRALKRSYVKHTATPLKYKVFANVSVAYGLLPHSVRYAIKKAYVKRN